MITYDMITYFILSYLAIQNVYDRKKCGKEMMMRDNMKDSAVRQ